MVYYHRFFMSRSLHKNDRFVSPSRAAPMGWHGNAAWPCALAPSHMPLRLHGFELASRLPAMCVQLVVAGAVLLASKVQESPRGLDDVSHVCFEAKHANKRDAWPTPQDKVR